MSDLVENSTGQNQKPDFKVAVDKPSNSNIKERLQESASDTSSMNNNNTTTSNNNNVEVKVRKQYTKRTEKPNTATISGGRRPKRVKLKQTTVGSTVSNRDTESVGSIASTSTTASAGDDEGSRDGNSQNTDLLHSPREKEKCPDLLSIVLNTKKRALFQNPEVVKFLQNMMDVLRK